MPTFIKAGFWKKARIGLNEWLNLDDLITNLVTSVTNSNIATIITDNNVVTSIDVTTIVALTQAEYDALSTKVATTLYVIVEP